MKSFRKELWFETPHRRDYINITPQVDEALRDSGVREGMCLVNAMHITASVFINDNESGLIADYDDWLEQLAPHEPISHYRHNQTGEDNGMAAGEGQEPLPPSGPSGACGTTVPVPRQVMGREVVVAVTGGQLDFGPWEQIFYGEFDGRRRKRVLVKIIGE
jgi:thiamine phosphate synthase YjbQ (UPF0047 family)